MTRMISTEKKNNKVGCSPRHDNNQTPKEHHGAAVDSRDNKRSSKIESLKSGTALFTLWTRGNRRNKVRFTSFESSRRPLLPERQDISSRTWQTCTTDGNDDENCTVESSSCNISNRTHEDEKESNRSPAECRAKATTATQRLQRSNASRFLLDSSLSTNMDTPSSTLLTHTLSLDATLHSDTYQTNMERGDEPSSCPPSSDLCRSHRPHKTDHDDILLVQLIHTDNDYEHHRNLHNEEAGSKQQHDKNVTTIADSVAPAFGALVLKRQPNQRDLFVLYKQERCDSFAVVHQPTIWKEEDRQKQKKSIEFPLCRQMGKIHLNVPQPLVVQLSRYILLHLHRFWDYLVLVFQALRNVHPPILLVLLTFVYTRNWNIIRYLSILLVVIHILAKVQTFLGMPLSRLRNMFQSRSLKKCRMNTKRRNGNTRPLSLLGKRKKGNFFFSKSNNDTPTHDCSKGTTLTTRPQMSEFKKQYAMGVGAIAFPLVIEFICDYYTVATSTIHETRLAEIRHVLNAWNERGENSSSSGGGKD